MSQANHHAALSKRDIFWGLAAQGLNIGLMVIMLPVILRHMSRAEVGIWLVFFAITGLVQLLELGFQYVLARSYSYVYAGAQELLPSGLQTGTGPLNENLLAILLTASRRIYLTIAILAAAVLWLGGTTYLYSVLPAGLSASTVLWSWAAFSTGYVVNFYYGYLNALLQGRGDMLQSNKVVVASKGTQLVVSIVLVAFFNAGLVGLGLASLLSMLVNRFLAFHFAYAPARTEMRVPPAAPDAARKMVKVLWHNARRYGESMIGGFLIARANVLIAASRIGVVETAGYSLALQVLIVMQVVSMLPFNLSLPRLSHLRAVGDVPTTYRVFSSTLAAAIMIFGFAGLGLLLFGNPLLRLIKSSTTLPDTALLATMIVIFFLELNHGICANLIAAGNEVPFGRAGLITGASSAVTGWIVTPYFGVAGLIAVVGLCELAYNNWKWPLQAARQFKVSFIQVLSDGFKILYEAKIKPALGHYKQ